MFTVYNDNHRIYISIPGKIIHLSLNLTPAIKARQSKDV